MKLDLKPINRWCVVERRRQFDLRAIRAEVLARETADGDFTLLGTTLPARDQTRFLVCSDGNELLVAAALFNSMAPWGFPAARSHADSLEIFFDPYHDHLGFFQFIFQGNETRPAITHLPYPAAQSTAFPEIELESVDTNTEKLSGWYSGWECRWVFARFAMAHIFRQGDTCGFNLCRSRPAIPENSSWNLCSGNGFQDATTFGHLHRSPPALELSRVEARLEGSRLQIAGVARGSLTGFDLELATPLDERCRMRVPVRHGRWATTVHLKELTPGRYRLYPSSDGAIIEPSGYCFDLVPARPKRPFCVSVTYDPPMCLIPNSYTPARLKREMATIAGWGFDRVHWIEYGDWPSFWNLDEYWGKNYRAARRQCGDLLACAVRQAHVNNLELFADLKIFDFSYNSISAKGHPHSRVADLERRPCLAIPEIASHPEWTMRANPEWLVPESFPVTRLRLYSEQPLPQLRAGDLRLWVSNDNRSFRPHRGGFRLRQGSLPRPHYRWTPAGKVKEDGHRTNWFVELAGLALETPYLAIEIARDVVFTHRGFMLVEAEGSSAALVPVTVATGGDRTKGLSFWKEWTSWVNLTEPILQRRPWSGKRLGMVFREAPSMPSLLEPACDGARDIWLERIRRILVAGADGVSIRTLCHHNGVSSYLAYVYADRVREEFRSRFARAPRTEAGDYERIRRIRGEFFTQFLRDARKLTSRCRRKLAFQLESGIEVPPQFDTRMQIHLDFETWFREELLDEVSLKWFTSQNPFVHERILPLARRRGVPVHVISRCLDGGLDARAMETTEEHLLGACRAGFSGFNFYETANLMEMNPLGVSTPKGFVLPAIARAMHALDALRLRGGRRRKCR